MVNRHRNKQDEFAKSGYDPVVGRSLGLNQSSMDQAKKYGGSIQTAINEGRAVKKGFFKPVEVIKKPTVSTPVKETRVTTRGDDNAAAKAAEAARKAAEAARRREERNRNDRSASFAPPPKPKPTKAGPRGFSRKSTPKKTVSKRGGSRRGGGGGRAKGGLMGKVNNGK